MAYSTYVSISVQRMGSQLLISSATETAWRCPTAFSKDRCDQEAVRMRIILSALTTLNFIFNPLPLFHCCLAYSIRYYAWGFLFLVNRNRASGTPHNASRKGGATAPKLAATGGRPRSSTTSSMPSALRMSPTSRIGGAGAGGAAGGAGGSLAMKRQRRTSTSAQMQSTATRKVGEEGTGLV